MQCETTLIWLEEIWSLLLICVPMETCFVHVSLHVFSFQGRMTIDMELHLPKTAKILPKSNPLVHYDVFLYKVAKSPVHSRVKHRVRWEDCKYCVWVSLLQAHQHTLTACNHPQEDLAGTCHALWAETVTSIRSHALVVLMVRDQHCKNGDFYTILIKWCSDSKYVVSVECNKVRRFLGEAIILILI